MVIDEQIKKAIECFNSNKLDYACQILSDVITHYPESISAYKTRCKVYVKMQNWNNAISDRDTLIRLEPNEASHYFFRAKYKMKVGFTKDAIEDLIEVLSLDCKSFYTELAHFFLAIGYEIEGNDSKVLEHCKFVRDDFSLYFLGRKQSKTKLVESAEKNCN